VRIGSLAVEPVFDGTGREPARESLSRPGTADPWACHADLLDAGGLLPLTVGGFLLRTGDRTILVDAGVGTITNGKYAGGRFLDSLLALGVAPAEVTDVVFTHLHFDHVGWATRKGEIVFPNAAYRVHAADWAHFVDSPDADPGAVRKLSPLAAAGRLEPFDCDVTIAPGLDARHVPGHTPGSVIYAVSSRGERAVLLGDVAHSPVQLTEPGWEAIFDVDPAAARRVRERLADEAADSGDVLAAAHFPAGRLIAAGGGRIFQGI
jgi:glyoxylase-like metal-dependent hydrolase (beta-lactamase superfamily II)